MLTTIATAVRLFAATKPRRHRAPDGAVRPLHRLVGGIPVGAAFGQTAFNVMAGGRTRWAVILSGLWMLVFVIALGPVCPRCRRT